MPVFICQGCGTEHASWEGSCPQCGVSETIRLAPQTDRMVDRVVKGKFKIIRKLGQGGMGAVYLAEQTGIGQRVALKFLKSEFSTDAEIARRFLNEAKSYARVAHPNAVTLHDFGQDDDGNLFIAMEYCEGVDLKKVIAEQGRLPLVEAVEVVLQVADVLATAHSKGVIHRDLKPENIMIRRGMRGVHAKVLDFGIARLMGEGTRLTVQGAIAGTPRYMSPEQVEGKDVDLRADIYALGIVLYETLTGKQPFDGNTIAEILRRQVVEPMPHLAEHASDLDYPDLDAVVQKACQKPPDARWPDMLTFASALSQAVPTQAHLSMPAIQRHGLSASSVNQTAPHQAHAASGIARPGMQPDAESTAQTLVKQSGTDLAAVTSASRADDAPVVAPRSKLPLVLVGLLVLLAVGVGATIALKRPPESPQLPLAIVQPPPEAALEAGQPVAANSGNSGLTDEVRQALKEQNALNNLTNGKTEFQVANLDAAEKYLSTVEAGTAQYDEAQKLLTTINRIHVRLGVANGLRGQGRCDDALPVFREVLQLNSRVAAARDGEAFCKRGSISTTME